MNFEEWPCMANCDRDETGRCRICGWRPLPEEDES